MAIAPQTIISATASPHHVNHCTEHHHRVRADDEDEIQHRQTENQRQPVGLSHEEETDGQDDKYLDSKSPAVLDRLAMRIRVLEEKRSYYEDILNRELTELDEQFTSLRYLSDELQIRARGLRVQKKAA